MLHFCLLRNYIYKILMYAICTVVEICSGIIVCSCIRLLDLASSSGGGIRLLHPVIGPGIYIRWRYPASDFFIRYPTSPSGIRLLHPVSDFFIRYPRPAESSDDGIRCSRSASEPSVELRLMYLVRAPSGQVARLQHSLSRR